MKKDFIKLIAISATLLLSGAVANAEDTRPIQGMMPTQGSDRPPMMYQQGKGQLPPQKPGVVGERRAINKEFRGQVASTTRAARTDIKDMRGEMRENMKEAREDMRGRIASTTDPLERQKMREEGRLEFHDMQIQGMKEIKERRDDAREDIMKAIEERKMRFASTTDPRRPRMASSTEVMKEARIAKNIEEAGKKADEMIKNITNQIDRLNKLSIRIQSRVEKVKAAGGDTTTASAALQSAASSISAAQNGIPAITEAFAKAAKLADPKNGRADIEKAVQAVRASLKSAQDSLNKAVESLVSQKGADTPPSNVLSSTPENTTTTTN